MRTLILAVLFCCSALCAQYGKSSKPTYSYGTQPANSTQYANPYSTPSSYNVPSLIYQCEGDQCVRGGGGAIWMFEGTHGQALWHYGAEANLSVKSFDGVNIWIHREDPNPSYSSPRFADLRQRPDGVFFADYRGTIQGDHIEGTVSWNGGGSGTWYGTLKPGSLCEPVSECPLSTKQLVQLGRQAVKAKMEYTATRCFGAASREGDPEGTGLAGVMVRDGIGVRADPTGGFLLLKQSAEQNDPGGELSLAQSYEQGLGVEPNKDLAAFWRTKAHDRIQQIKVEQAQQQHGLAFTPGQIVAGAVVVGLLGLMISSALDSSEQSSDRRESRPITGSPYVWNYEAEREAAWYSKGGSAGGPPSGWTKWDPLPAN